MGLINFSQLLQKEKATVRVAVAFLLCLSLPLGVYFGNEWYIKTQKEKLINQCGLPNMSIVTSTLPEGNTHTDVPWSVDIIGEVPFAYRANLETGLIDYLKGQPFTYGLLTGDTGQVVHSNPVSFRYFASGPSGFMALKSLPPPMGLAYFPIWFVVSCAVSAFVFFRIMQAPTEDPPVEEELPVEEPVEEEAPVEEPEAERKSCFPEAEKLEEQVGESKAAAKRLKQRTKVLGEKLDEETKPSPSTG